MEPKGGDQLGGGALVCTAQITHTQTRTVPTTKKERTQVELSEMQPVSLFPRLASSNGT